MLKHMYRSLWPYLLVLFVGLLPLLAFSVEGEESTEPLTREELIWSVGLYAGPNPLELSDWESVENPLFTHEQITDREALFVADPFFFETEDTLYLLIEVALADPYGHGDLAVATSTDEGKSWTYQGVILDEPFHLSYPQVFEHEGEYYMLPETWETATMRLYKATNFPYEWSFVKTLVDVQNVDPSILQQDDHWYIFCATNAANGWDTTRLYHADELLGDWSEHPSSPIVAGDRDIARPAGPMLRYDGSWWRLAQDTAPIYGHHVNAFRITELTPTRYEEQAWAGNPILHPAEDEPWTSMGMHQIDVFQLEDGSWLGCVDGQAYQDFSFPPMKRH